MPQKRPPPLAALPAPDSPLVLFAKLDLAVERGDFAAAAVAQRELADLGVEVRYGTRPARRGREAAGAD